MPRTISSLELTLGSRRQGQTIASWLYRELRNAILDGRLKPGARLPASRDFAKQYGFSRGTIVGVFERMQAEGYLSSRVGFGTWINRVAPSMPLLPTRSRSPAYIREVAAAYVRPKAWVGITQGIANGPFQMAVPALIDSPVKLWGRITAQRARKFSSWLRTEDDGHGYRPLREAVAQYLGSSRSVKCHADQIILVSGAQQGLDLLARLLLKPGDPVWIEDPGYFGANIAFNAAGARLVPVPVDSQGLSVDAGLRICPHAKGVYLTPAHQFPLGMTMSLERRRAVLKWAAKTGAFVIEDDYDSEYRFDGHPVPALQSLDRNSSVIFVGSFNKLLFPSLRVGYVVLPPTLVDYFYALRSRTDFRSLSLEQAVLCEFIVEGHLARHIRRTRDQYGSRLATLIEACRKHLNGVLEISTVQAGLYTAAFLQNGMSSWKAEDSAAAHGLVTAALDRYTLAQPDPKGLLLGFAAFEETGLRKAVIRLAEALRNKS